MSRRFHANYEPIFFKAYGNKTNNCKATAEHGWFPSNRKLLEHSSLVTKQQETVLNAEEGLAGSVLDCLMQERSQSCGAKKAAEKRKLTSDAIADNIKNHNDSLPVYLSKMLSTVLTMLDFWSRSASKRLKMKKRRRQEDKKEGQGKHAIHWSKGLKSEM